MCRACKPLGLPNERRNHEGGSLRRQRGRGVHRYLATALGPGQKRNLDDTYAVWNGGTGDP